MKIFAVVYNNLHKQWIGQEEQVSTANQVWGYYGVNNAKAILDSVVLSIVIIIMAIMA